LPRPKRAVFDVELFAEAIAVQPYYVPEKYQALRNTMFLFQRAAALAIASAGADQLPVAKAVNGAMFDEVVSHALDFLQALTDNDLQALWRAFVVKREASLRAGGFPRCRKPLFTGPGVVSSADTPMPVGYLARMQAERRSRTYLYRVLKDECTTLSGDEISSITGLHNPRKAVLDAISRLRK